MILYQKNNPDYWFSWDTVTMKHYYPKTDYRVIGPTKWNLKHNLSNGTSILGPNVMGSWQDE